MTLIMGKPALALGCDHAGFEYKELLKTSLIEKGFPVEDFGTHSSDSVDYPDFVHPVCDSVEAGKNTFGILICGSANGVKPVASSRPLWRYVSIARAGQRGCKKFAASASGSRGALLLVSTMLLVCPQSWHAIRHIDTFRHGGEAGALIFRESDRAAHASRNPAATPPGCSQRC